MTSRMISTVDTHTAGAPTRIILAGIPVLRGPDVASKMEDFRQRHDALRLLLMREPRGHNAMYGAVLTPPSREGADTGVFFLTTEGYLRSCVHSSIGLVTAGLQLGFITPGVDAERGRIGLETPGGLITLLPRYSSGRLESIAVQTRPAFLLEDGAKLEFAPGRTVHVAIAFSGLFYLLVDVHSLGSPSPAVGTQSARNLAHTGTLMLEAANRVFRVSHPENPEINTIEQVVIYETIDNRSTRDIVVTRSGGIDRSPCGAGTGAMLAYLLSKGRLRVGEEHVMESFAGGRFSGRVLDRTRVGPHDAVVPEIRGTAFVTGMHQFILDRDDPLVEGLAF